MFEITYHEQVLNDLEKLDKPELLRIRETIERKLCTKPELYGTRLRGQLREYWKLRVGDYRTVYKVKNKSVYILIIAHRKEVYKLAEKRT